jgi:CO/xanthine dehydrogenase Mo-binding subunit
MADHKLIGKNYQTPDLVAKVTGKARYAEDYRAEGMLFTKLLLSPRPHARVTRIDASAALAMPGGQRSSPPTHAGAAAAARAPAAPGGAGRARWRAGAVAPRRSAHPRCHWAAPVRAPARHRCHAASTGSRRRTSAPRRPPVP